MRLMESNRIRMSPCIRPYALRPCSPNSPPWGKPSEAHSLLPSAPPSTISDSLYRTEKQVLFSVTVYATIIHAICALVKPFLLFLYCFLAVLPIDFRHIVEGTCAERENVL